MSLDQQFTGTYDKLQLLIREYRKVQKENVQLREQLQKAHAKQATQAEKIDELQQQISILKSAAGELSEKDKKEFERRLNQYIKDVEKCIAVLSE